jgi:endonuclease/exonuclease/phosphatase (EEP) superfamily protein YafD
LRRSLARLITLACGLYTLLILSLWLVLRYAGDRWWPATFLLFSPRWVWIVPCPPLLALALCFRRRLAWLPALTGLAVVFGVMGMHISLAALRRPGSSAPAGANTVRIVTANLHGRQADPRVLDEFLSRTQPDVVTFQDFDPRLRLRFFAAAGGGWQARNSHGVMVASRWPLTQIDSGWTDDLVAAPPEAEPADATDDDDGDAPEGRRGAIGRYLVHAPGGEFEIAALHLVSPHLALSMMRIDRRRSAILLAQNGRRRARESAALAEQLRREPGPPLIIAGDFNTTEDSPIFRQVWSGYPDAFAEAGIGFGTTYALHRTWLRIDHVLHDGQWTCQRCFTSSDVGSGHRAVFAELSRR